MPTERPKPLSHTDFIGVGILDTRLREAKVEQYLNEDSLIFWREPLDRTLYPFSTKLRRDILVQLRNQFGVNPREWRYKAESGEGHWHYQLLFDDRV